MKWNLIYLIVIIFCFIQILYSFDVSSTDIIGEAEKMSKAKEIFKNIQDSDFVKSAKSINKWCGPLLSSLGFFAKAIISKIGSESKELKFMKEQFEIINNKMDVVDQRFSEVKNLLDWNSIKISFAKYEMSINLLQDKIQAIVEAPYDVKKMLVDEYLLTFDQIYGKACDSIYLGFISKNKIYSENLISAVRKFTNDDTIKVEHFFMGNMNILLKGLEVETFYYTYSNYSNLLTKWQKKWNDQLKILTSLMTSSLAEIKKNWKIQFKEDIEKYNVNNQGKSIDEYANGLYQMLNKKFSWRDWFVFVYDPLDKGKDHAYKNCNEGDTGVTQMQHRGYNVLVNSVGKGEKTGFSSNSYASFCRIVPVKLVSWGHGPAHYLMLHYAQQYVDCKKVKMAIVLRSKSTKTYLSPVGHSSTCRWSGYYNRFVEIHKTLDVIFIG